MTSSEEKTNYPTSEQAAAGSYQKALLLKQQQRYEEAIHQFQNAIDKNPNNINYIIELAVCYLNLNNFSHVINILTPLYRKDPKNTVMLKPYCSALIESGQVEKAKGILENIKDQLDSDLALKALWLKATGVKFNSK